jgi:methionyl-tRNA formyltransferase
MRIGFLGYDRTRTVLIRFLEERGHEVTHAADRVEDLSRFDLVVSFGYRHLLRPPALATVVRPVLNLHISFLPYNRGAHPNFWSWVEGTPSGVSIHEIDAGIDTGPVVAQATLEGVHPGMTLRETHGLLIALAERLFRDHAVALLAGEYRACPQIGVGTHHSTRDLPAWMTNWDVSIRDAVAEYRRRA